MNGKTTNLPLFYIAVMYCYAKRVIKMSWFAIRRKDLEKLLEDKEWGERFDRCKTVGEKQQVVEQFCRERGLKFKRINL